ncbi:SH3 domain-containing protein [Methylocystis iwaonis]|uniref:SH3 domain-containing protein n=1 Tax=Methylocystis iwaonis TaxID=2885079 RepID=UPI0033142B2D
MPRWFPKSICPSETRQGGAAKILGRAVYGSRVEVLGQDGRWVQVHAIGQTVAGWVERAGLNF